MHRSSHLQGYNATSQYKDAAGYGVLSPICNIGSSANSTLNNAVDGPWISGGVVGGGCVVNNQWSGITGHHDGATARFYTYTVDLATGTGSGAVLLTSYSTDLIGGALGVSDVPIILFRRQNNPSIGNLVLSGGVRYRYATAAVGSGINQRYVYKDGKLFYSNTSTGRMHKGDFVVENGVDDAPVYWTSASNLGLLNGMDVDSTYLYCLNGTTITQLLASDGSFVATLTHPNSTAPVNDNQIRCTEYGQLLAIGNLNNSKIWKHTGSNTWAEVSSNLGSAAPAEQQGPQYNSLAFIHRNVLYALKPNVAGNLYSLYKSISPC